jgi:hypothetical protein
MVTFNPSKSKLICGDYTPSSEFENLIYDGEGSSTETEQLVELNCDGFNIVVIYDLYIDGSISYSKGDYWTPDYTEVNVNDVDITIKSVEIDEYEVELTKEMSKIFENIVKQLI